MASAVITLAGFVTLTLGGGSAAGQDVQENLPIVGTLQVDGIAGTIELHQVNLGIVGVEGGITGGGIQPAVLEPLSVAASVGEGAPELIELALTGQMVRTITVDLLDPITQRPTGRLSAQNVQVSNVTISTDEGNLLLTVEWRLDTANAVRIESGGASFCWDASRTRPC